MSRPKYAPAEHGESVDPYCSQRDGIDVSKVADDPGDALLLTRPRSFVHQTHDDE